MSDSGIGIPAAKRAHIFEAFEQADRSTTRKYGGTGLGLAISSHLVQMMGGKIWLDDEEHNGSNFHFTVHFLLDKNAQTLATATELKGLRVLVVDDDAVSRRELRQIFAEWDITFEEAESGEAAIFVMKDRQAQGEPFTLVLMDEGTGELIGVALAQRIREESARCGIIMLRSLGEHVPETSAGEPLVTEYLKKPFTKSELFDVLQRIHRRAQPPSTSAGRTPKTNRAERSLKVLLAL